MPFNVHLCIYIYRLLPHSWMKKTGVKINKMVLSICVCVCVCIWMCMYVCFVFVLTAFWLRNNCTHFTKHHSQMKCKSGLCKWQIKWLLIKLSYVKVLQCNFMWFIFVLCVCDNHSTSKLFPLPEPNQTHSLSLAFGRVPKIVWTLFCGLVFRM